jgi:opacity protein-like surface antigen
MKRFFRFLFASIVMLLLFVMGWCFPTVAGAADLAVKAPIYTPSGYVGWGGLYISGYGLYAADTAAGTQVSNATGSFLADIASAPRGPGVGGAIGYYFQPTPGGIVFGPRVDLAYAHMTGGGSIPSVLSVSNATNYLGDVDLIVGLPLGDGKLLAYLGGGFAFGGAKPNLQVATLQQAAADTSTGLNGLAGLSYQFTPNWQIFIEGNYFQLGDKSLTMTDSTGALIATSLTKYHIFEQKVGVTFKLY